MATRFRDRRDPALQQAHGRHGIDMIRHGPEGKGQHDRAVAVAHGCLIGTTGFVAFARANHWNFRDRSQAGQGLDWLVAGAIFTKTNAVVGQDVDHA